MRAINLTGKIALVAGVADNVGFGWHIAKTLQDAGAQVILSCHPRVQKIVENFLTMDKYRASRKLPFSDGDFSPIKVIPCDVAYSTMDEVPVELKASKGYGDYDFSIAGLMAETAKIVGHLDVLIHSIAFSPEISKNHLEVNRGAYLTAMSVSSYSLVALARAAQPLMDKRSGAIVALSYLASERAVPFYGGGMASAKAALECDARMLAWFLGEHGHRVNIISAGPYASRAAKSIGDIQVMIDSTAGKSPLRSAITPQNVADTTLFLCSDLASGITASTVYVDAGYHAMAG